MNDHYVAQFLSFQFYDSAGLITFTGLGTTIYLDNEEAIPQVINKNPIESRVSKTQSGRAASGIVLHPESWNITVRNRKALSFYKCNQLIYAFSQGYRCVFRILAGNMLWDQATTSFKHFNIDVDPAIAEFNQTDYRKLVKGIGMKNDELFAFTIYQGVNLTLPATGDSNDQELQDIQSTIQGELIESLIVN